jgi:hypothetical protein
MNDTAKITSVMMAGCECRYFIQQILLPAFKQVVVLHADKHSRVCCMAEIISPSYIKSGATEY